MSSSASIHQRLLQIEEEFLRLASTNDIHAMGIFEEKWVKLHTDIETGTHAKTMDAATTVLAHSVASKIAIFAESFLSIRTQYHSIATTLVDQLQTELDGLNLESVSGLLSPPPPSASSLSTTTRPDASSLPSYIEPAYRWLLKHLHNPYPSKEVKQRFADETGTSVERISDWFVDARRRMGWTRLLRDEFYRKRSALVDAARRYYKIDGGPPLPDIIIGRFVQIDSFAKEMYAAKLEPSPLSLKLTTAIKDLTPELQEKAREQRRQQKSQAPRDAVKAAAYPSPASSGVSSPVSDPGASTSRKRSSSDASVDDERSFSKRSRTDDGPSSDAFNMPSPPDSRHPSPSSSARKRRLSDADAPGAKRPRNRAASDPIPVTVTLSGTPDLLADWFSSDKEGDTDIFNPGQLLDIKFFDPADYDIPDELAASPAEPVLQELKTVPQQTLEPPEMLTFDIPSEIQSLFNFSDLEYSTDFCQPCPPSFGSFAANPYTGPDPAVYEPPTYLGQFNDGFDGGYITQQSVAESLGYQPASSYDPPAVYSAFSDGKVSGDFAHGYTEQQHKIQNEYTMYQAADF